MVAVDEDASILSDSQDRGPGRDYVVGHTPTRRPPGRNGGPRATLAEAILQIFLGLVDQIR